MSDGSMESYVLSGKSFTAVAINTASKAGEWVKTKLGAYQQLEQKTSPRDLVTEVDKGAEALIRNLLHAHFPHHAILGEEGVKPGSEASSRAIDEMKESEYLWIVDPIDGTTNFVHGFPFFSISIALAHRGDVIVGVVYDPNRDEMFVGEKGKGAYVRGRRMRVSREATLAESLLAGGLAGDREWVLPANLAGIRAIAPKVRNVRLAGSAALHMAYVAAGRLSGFWEIGLNPWDMAAGKLLVEEAGGTVTDTLGRPYSLETRNVVATNGHIHQELLRELAAANATGER
jgi:myo-inositol-1(or 4)-monophosphatase